VSTCMASHSTSIRYGDLQNHGLWLVEDAAAGARRHLPRCSGGGFWRDGLFQFLSGEEPRGVWRGGRITTNREDYWPASPEPPQSRLGRPVLSRRGRLQHADGWPGAASLGSRLKYLPTGTLVARRLLADIRRRSPTQSEDAASAVDRESVYHLFVITVRGSRRDGEVLNEPRSIRGFHYPVACHLQKAYASLGIARRSAGGPNTCCSCLSAPM